jgi:branched-chain amino acid transport system substrate-binding protein
MKKTGILVAMFLVGCMLTWGLGFVPEAVAKKKPILIGHIHTMSGAMSMYGISCTTGGQIAVEEINAAGGVLGRPLKQITRDDKLSPEMGLRQAKSLLLEKEVDFLSGTISSAVGMAISAYVKKKKKIFITNIAQTAAMTEQKFHRYYFRIGTNTVPYFGYAPAGVLAKKYGDKKIVSLGFDYVSGHAASHDFWERYKQLVPDSRLVKEFWAPLGTTDFTPYISGIMGTDAEALVLQVIYGGGERAFVKQAVPAGIFKKFHVVSACSGDAETWSNVKKGQPAPTGALSTCRYPFWAIKDPKSIAFAKEHHARVGFWPSYGAMDQYFIVYALKAAIEKAGGVDTEKIVDALEGMVMDTFVGKIKIRECDHQAMMPTWVGVMGWGAAPGFWSEEEAFPHLVDISVPDNIESTYHSCEQIMELRKKAGK